MNVAFGDVLNSGGLAIYVSNSSEEGILIQGNNLWVPKEGTAGEGLKYENLARDFGVELGGWSFGAQFGDLNNDGNLDLFVTNGYISLDRNRSYWYDFAKVAGGERSIIYRGPNWPAIGGPRPSRHPTKHRGPYRRAARVCRCGARTRRSDKFEAPAHRSAGP